MKISYIATIILFLTQTVNSYADWNKYSTRQLYDKLDSVIANNDKLVREKLDKIEELTQKTKTVKNLEEKFWLNKIIYDEYFVFIADSAMKYVDDNIAIAKELKKNDWISTWTINKAFLFSATGLLKESFDVISSIDENELPKKLKLKYYEQVIYLLSHTEQYIGDKGVFVKDIKFRINEVSQKMHDLIETDSPYYLWYKNIIYNSTGKNAERKQFLNEMKDIVDKSKLENRVDAMNAYALAHLYLDNNDKENYERYLICSAIADTKIINRDMASLEEISNILYEKNDIDRAYKYINFCLTQALLYPNRVRVVGISILMDKISMAYKERDVEQRKLLRTFLIVTFVMSAILLVSIFLIYIQLKKIRKSNKKIDNVNQLLNSQIQELSNTQRQLAEANSQLSELNNELHSTNDKLIESNYVKEEYIGYVFSICSNYISKMEDFRKNISRKLKAGQIEEIKKLTASTITVQTELKEFYKSFDAIFIHVYPDFVEDFNKLLKPEERIVLKNNECLNTELRIFALIRLGINDSTKIADFLHCSPQTVYNNRLKTRNKAIISKEEFAEAVRSLGKANAGANKEQKDNEVTP